MKLEPPVPVPVDSILSWGCGGNGSSGADDDDDLLNGKFNSCDMADSTTGGSLHDHHHMGGGSSSGMAGGSGSAMMSGQHSHSGGPMNQSNKATLLSLDNLDGLLLSGATVLTTPTTPGPGPGGGHSFAELKPLALPPFESYGGGSSMDGGGSSGHHHHQMNSGGGGGTRTILDINLNLYKASSSGSNNNNNNNNSGNNNNNLNYYSGGGGGGGEPVSTTTLVNGLVSVGVVKAESMADYLMNPEIDDIAAIIGNAIADSTVASAASAAAAAAAASSVSSAPVSSHVNVSGVGLGGVESLGPDIRDPWADIDAWIESACSTVYKHEPMLESPASSVTSGTSHSSLSSVSPAFAHPSQLPPMSSLQQSQQQQHNNSCSVSSTLQALLSQGAAAAGSVALAHMSQHDPSGGGNTVKSEPSMDMPLLQRRLTAGRPENNNNGQQSNFNSCSMAGSSSSSTKEGLQLPHTTFQHSGQVVSTSLAGQHDPSGCHSSGSYVPATARRSTAVKSSYSSKDLSDLDDPMSGGMTSNNNGGGGGGGNSNGPGRSKHKNRSTKAKMTTVMTTDGSGKEKPVHRCNICNRGFLNKSNIKVHLRTHTGEKPFKCDACAKAFRQKAHLLKHMQIHKRITRD